MLAMRPYSANKTGLGNILNASALSLVISENAISLAAPCGFEAAPGLEATHTAVSTR
jgi:hypothetical protein